MPSRINMGPDGGPYIAINENNGNIELEDNTGTTVAKWDDANSQWDFQNNPISNVDSLTSNSLNTGKANITDLGETNLDKSPSNVAGSRSLSTTYQNTTGNTWWILVRLQATVDSAFINSTLNVARTASEADSASSVVNGSKAVYDTGEGPTLVGLVPPNYYYRIREFGDVGDYEISIMRERGLVE